MARLILRHPSTPRAVAGLVLGHIGNLRGRLSKSTTEPRAELALEVR